MFSSLLKVSKLQKSRKHKENHHLRKINCFFFSVFGTKFRAGDGRLAGWPGSWPGWLGGHSMCRLQLSFCPQGSALRRGAQCAYVLRLSCAPCMRTALHICAARIAPRRAVRMCAAAELHPMRTALHTCLPIYFYIVRCMYAAQRCAADLQGHTAQCAAPHTCSTQGI